MSCEAAIAQLKERAIMLVRDAYSWGNTAAHE